MDHSRMPAQQSACTCEVYIEQSCAVQQLIIMLFWASDIVCITVIYSSIPNKQHVLLISFLEIGPMYFPY